MEVAIVHARQDEFHLFCPDIADDMILLAFAFVDGKPALMSGLRTLADGRYFGFFDVLNKERGRVAVVAAMRTMRRCMRNLGQPIYVQCERSATAAQMMRAFGLEPTGEELEDRANPGTYLEVYKWQP